MLSVLAQAACLSSVTSRGAVLIERGIMPAGREVAAGFPGKLPDL
jgi:hypothetical protein